MLLSDCHDAIESGKRAIPVNTQLGRPYQPARIRRGTKRRDFFPELDDEEAPSRKREMRTRTRAIEDDESWAYTGVGPEVGDGSYAAAVAGVALIDFAAAHAHDHDADLADFNFDAQTH